MKILILLSFFLIGCSDNTHWGNEPFVEMDSSSMINGEQTVLCERKPESIFCSSTDSTGDIQPTSEYARDILLEMNSNFKYKADSTWHYNDNVHEYLKGDCEDIASTMAKHMIEDGVGPKYLHLAYRKISETEGHLFLAVDTIDRGMLHLDYSNSGYPIEPKINFHMRMDDVGVHKWVKGNIQTGDN